MPSAPSAPASPSHPAPPHGRPEAGAQGSTGTAPRIGRLLILLRWIITYGQELAATLQQGTDPHRFAALAFRFQTPDLAAILARIARGLMLAGALQAKLAQWQAAGRDVEPSPLRLPTTRRPRDPAAETKPKVRHTDIIDLPLDRLPSAEAIAAELRRRPIGAVLVDICRDLGELPGDLTRERWDELALAVIAYGGDMPTLLFGSPLHDKLKERTRRFLAGQSFDDATTWFVPDLPPGAAASSTDPPDNAPQSIAA
jgi:hypothetical protein